MYVVLRHQWQPRIQLASPTSVLEDFTPADVGAHLPTPKAWKPESSLSTPELEPETLAWRCSKGGSRDHSVNQTNSQVYASNQPKWVWISKSACKILYCWIINMRVNAYRKNILLYLYSVDDKRTIKATHQLSSVYECPVCHKQLRSISGFRGHVIKQHPQFNRSGFRGMHI
jgi:hypothetical protein